MRTIVVKLHRTADFSGTMTSMRTWLDQRRCEPSRFTYDQSPGWFVISVDFPDDDDAEAFGKHFRGSEKAVRLDMTSKATWWRLMAEEIRTEADDFASTSAKGTMLFAAQTLERMAKDLERRLDGNEARIRKSLPTEL
jgi:hypothetical protein